MRVLKNLINVRAFEMMNGDVRCWIKKYRHVTNVEFEICNCISWQLKGIPHAHGISA